MVFVEMWFVLPPAQLPFWAALGAICTELPEYVLGIHPVERGLVALGSCWFAIAPALVFELAGRPAAALDARTLLLFAGALAAQFALDFATSAARERAALGVTPRQLAEGLTWVLAIDVVLAPVGLLAAIAARVDDAALLLPLPLLVMIGLSTRERQTRMDQALELSSAYRGTAFLLGDVVEADDAYTGEHSRDVLDLVLAVADELQLDPRSRMNAEFAALLHDVGKIKIPVEIINKPGPLSPDERIVINTHTIEGQRLLQRVGGRLGEVGRIVRSCHENWDGSGYPDGLAGTEIPLVARIVSCCDAFSAMTTNRSYRKARSIAEALDELERCAGSQFDPAVVAALVRLVHSGAIALERGGEVVPLARPA
jgi:HD-GYP domain-containing protein (c-di-GMP phosphodiesterase class II)